MRRGLATLAAALVVACGGAPPPADQSALAAKATEPRSGDVTAASPTPSPKQLERPGAGATATGPTSVPSGKTADAPTRIGARHVLVMYMGSERAPASVVRTREQAMALATEVLRRARAGEDVARLAVEYSDEPGAGGRGGSLGRFGKGQMVPAFEAAAFKLKVGEVSEVVETPFGFHVIQRTE